MILAIDMGNSNIKIGIVKDKDHVIEERINTVYNSTSFEYAEHIENLFLHYGVRKEEFSGAIMSSVVPPLTAVLGAAVNKVLGVRPILVTNRLKTTVSFPEPVGADLVVGAEAAYALYQSPCIIVNMGTATTITVVDRDGVFRGGVILPGMKTALNALSQNAATLPAISLGKPGSTISFDTDECMRSGIIYGSAGQIDAIVARMEAELGYECKIIATGGMARFCVPYCSRSVKLMSSLLMIGLMKIYEENTVSGKPET